MAQIKFNSRGSSAAFGNFAPGDVLVCSDELAKHFVEDAQCANYVEPKSTEAPAAAPSAKAGKKAAAKASQPSAE